MRERGVRASKGPRPHHHLTSTQDLFFVVICIQGVIGIQGGHGTMRPHDHLASTQDLFLVVMHILMEGGREGGHGTTGPHHHLASSQDLFLVVICILILAFAQDLIKSTLSSLSIYYVFSIFLGGQNKQLLPKP